MRGNGIVREAELASYIGSWDQLFGVRALEFIDGPGRGVRVLDVDSGGGLRFDVLVDRGFDIGRLTYMGMPLSWMSPTGVVHPNRYERSGDGWLRGFQGGMLTTCGLQTIGAPSTDAGRSWGLHGDASYLSASSVLTDVDPGKSRILVSAVLRDASALGPILVLHRTYEVQIGGSSIKITDVLRNEGVDVAEYEMLYHFNFGFPFLSELTEIEFPEGDVITPLDDVAEKAIGHVAQGGLPDPEALPEIFHHSFEGASDACIVVRNRHTPLGFLEAAIEYSVELLPSLWQWKMLRARTYVLGIEPATGTVMGREAGRAAGLIRSLEPGASVTHSLRFAIRELGMTANDPGGSIG